MRTQHHLGSLAAIIVVLALGAHLFMHLLPTGQAPSAPAAAPLLGETVLAGETPALLAVPADVAPAPDRTGPGHTSVMVALCMAVLVATVASLVLTATRRPHGPADKRPAYEVGRSWLRFAIPPAARPSRIDAGVVLIV